jgi:hypothetical protein
MDFKGYARRAKARTGFNGVEGQSPRLALLRLAVLFSATC